MKNLLACIFFACCMLVAASANLFFGLNASLVGAPVTYVSQAQGTGTPLNQYEPNYVLLSGSVSVTASGSCTSFGMYVSAAGAGNAKFALYDASGARIYLSGVIAIAATTGWKEVTGVSISVTAQIYKVSLIDDGANMGWEVDGGRTAQYGNGDGDYTAGPPATFPANNTPPTGQPTVRMIVQ